MVTYGDYFSRNVLHQCGISPDKTLLNSEENTYTGTQRTENIRSQMIDIYKTLYRGYAEKNVETKENFDDFQVERKIVSAFYDSGVLTNAERDYFKTQAIQNANERERISVDEANLSSGQVKAQKIDAPIKTPLERKI